MALTFWVLASLVQLAFCYLSSTELSLLQIVAHTVRLAAPRRFVCLLRLTCSFP